MKKILKSFLAAGILTIGAATASATIVLDDFDSGAQQVCDPTVFTCSAGTNTSEVAGSMLGGWRYMQADGSGGGVVTGDADTPVFPNILNYASSGPSGGIAGARGLLLVWDGAGGGTIGTGSMFNLPLVSGVQFDVLGHDLPGTIQFFVFDSSGNSAATAAFALAGPGTFSIPFFGLGGVDLTNIASFRAFITGTGAGALDLDAQFDNFRLTQVPEPGTYALMGAGLLGLALFRRRRA
jgi:hypothetical protein